MKILIATNYYYPNVHGVAKFAYNLAQGLSKRGHKVFVISPARNFKNSVVKENDVKVYRLRSFVVPNAIYPGGLPLSPFILNKGTIKNIIKVLKPDVIHIQDHFMFCKGLIEEGREMGVPILGTNHFMPENFLDFLYPFELGRAKILNLGWKHFLSIYNELDLITTPTLTAAKLLKKLEIKRDVIPVSNGIDLKRFNPKNDGGYLKKKYHLPENTPIVLYLGRLDKEKRIDNIISAFSTITKQQNAHLVIAGRGTEQKKLQRLSKKLDLDSYITFTGFVADEDIPFMYKIADLFVMASIAELQSIATMEALASGLPVVAANVMALPELVQDGTNGYLFPAGNVEILARKIMNILKDKNLRLKMSRNSLKIIQSHDLSHTISSYESIYKQMIHKNKQNDFELVNTIAPQDLN